MYLIKAHISDPCTEVVHRDFPDLEGGPGKTGSTRGYLGSINLGTPHLADILYTDNHPHPMNILMTLIVRYFACNSTWSNPALWLYGDERNVASSLNPCTLSFNTQLTAPIPLQWAHTISTTSQISSRPTKQGLEPVIA